MLWLSLFSQQIKGIDDNEVVVTVFNSTVYNHVYPEIGDELEGETFHTPLKKTAFEDLFSVKNCIFSQCHNSFSARVLCISNDDLYSDCSILSVFSLIIHQQS